ncbi:HEPN domain-containing protein [Saccharolobus islandicus]|uniref:HEPN domain-containing protein n=1 Tax=Saccharolobus islandicus LAL14/1 TaxID=1241935 RepID=M9UDG4_SACIS|nr:HEPN domain-containing protein [Sulfolobus islandicus]AGJ62240.1 HEPN domain-containing protein [Sulfolobus islandicus LAL14/1]
MNYKEWIEQALEDLDTAKVLLTNGKYYASAFYSQQAVEKSLKSLIIYLGKDPGKTHSLTELIEMVEKEGVTMPINIKENLMVLSPHFIISRYLDAANGVPFKQYSKSISEDLYNRAKEVIEWVKENLQ